MVDINKYLEMQLALEKQRCKQKSFNVTDKSKQAAESISKKQNNPSKKSKSYCNINTINKTQSKSSHDITDDSEYLPSSDDEEMSVKDVAYSMPTTSKRAQNINKIIDDGDLGFYTKRIDDWKTNLANAISSKHEDCTSADIQYILDGHQDYNNIHELQNGLCIPQYIWKQLFKYQRVGVKWLWELHQTDSGGLLGDEMGLGKTVQIIAFLVGLSKTDSGGSFGGLGPSIIVAPATVIFQWVSHFHYWYPPLRVAVLHNSGSHAGNHHKLIRDIHTSHGILLLTYAGIVKYNKDLLARKWHYIILDEGHKIRNPDTQVSKIVKKFPTPHRLLITGSPMQNSLQELWSLFDFMRPGLLGTHTAFMEHFAYPITQGGYSNATEIQEASAMEIAKALKDMITPYMLRRTKAEVQEYIKLPEKNEQVLFCALSQEQRDLYLGYLMSETVRSILDKDCKFRDPLRARILVALSTLRKICNHPDLYLYEAQEELEDIDEEKFGHWKRSGKMMVVQSLLKIWQKQGHRALLFSQSRAMICILEQFFQQQGYKYLRMDGTVNVKLRQNLIKTFNENDEYLIFLATTRVGGLGVNLTGANRVIIYDPDWNPATDSQAKERAWRIGQQRNVTVYRLISAGTIEEKIYQRQVFKHLLGNKVLIDPNQKNFLTTSTLQGLFSLEDPNPDGDTETSSLFKHTKVDPNKKTNSVSTKNNDSAKKLEEMHKKAKEISRKISLIAKTKQRAESDDARERYKKKRDLILHPPKEPNKPEINLMDNKVTNAPFETVLSEIDIINMHVKKDYEQNLIKILNSSDVIEPIVAGNMCEDQSKDNDTLIDDAINCIDNKEEQSNVILEKLTRSKISDHSVTSRSLKRKKSTDPQTEIQNLVAIKKVKNKSSKKDRTKKSDDDYVLSKLFAKSTVKNALQHDAIVGLAEKEKRYRLKEEASRRAKDAVRAIKFSSK